MVIQNTAATTAPALCDITGQVKEAVAQSGVREGVCVVCSKSPTAGVLVTSFWDPLGHEDILDDLERIFPPRTNYAWQGAPEAAAAHSAAALCGRPLDFIIQEGELVLGHSQGIYLLDPMGGQDIPYAVTCL